MQENIEQNQEEIFEVNLEMTKKSYETPQLIKHGSIKDETLSGSVGSGTDNCCYS